MGDQEAHLMAGVQRLRIAHTHTYNIYTRPNLLLPATEIAMYNAELQESKFASNLPPLSSNLSRILSGNLSRILSKFEQFCQHFNNFVKF